MEGRRIRIFDSYGSREIGNGAVKIVFFIKNTAAV